MNTNYRTPQQTNQLISAKKIYRFLSIDRLGNDKQKPLAKAYEMGLIKKSDLIDGKVYFGNCRNATIAKWDAGKQRFIYKRVKFNSSFDEEIPHPEDDEGFDIFVPVDFV